METCWSKQKERVTLNPVKPLIDEGCPHYHGLDDLPVFVADNLDFPSSTGDRVDNGGSGIDEE